MIHRAHDYRHLTQRWRALARKAGLKLTVFAETAGFDLLCVRSPALQNAGGLYISAGIHGDEPGATEGLIEWAEKHAAKLARLPIVLFPCLNPWGLTHNIRLNEAGLDLNRAFSSDKSAAIVALREILHGYRFSAALALHEDYDAQGIYLYEGLHAGPFWGEMLLEAARRAIPIEARTRIDFGRPRNGIVRRRFDARREASLGGLPEAVYLQRHHTKRVITFETPSEFGLDRRASAHLRCIEAAIKLII